MTASMSDLITKVGEPGTLTTLQAPGKPIGAPSLLLNSPVNWPASTAVFFSMQRINIATGVVEPGSYTVWKGLLNGSSIDGLELKYGVDQAYAPGEGVQVFIYVSTTWANSLIDGILASHNPDGTPKQIPGFYIPTGVINEYAGATAPSGYLLCDGAAVSRATYAALFAVTGVLYGAGNGTTTFNVPNKKGRVGVGLDPSDTDFNTLGKSGGQKTVQKHVHNVRTGFTAVPTANPTANIWNGNQPSSAFDVTSTEAGTGITNMNPFLTMNFIIKT